MSYKTHIKIMPGQGDGKIMLFTLSTCIWCKKTKALFSQLGLKYSYVDVDLLVNEDQDEADKEMVKFHKHISYPTIIINDGEKVIVGFQEEEIKKLK